MSRLAVRQKIDSELDAFAAANGIIHHQTIDVYLETNDDVWITARYLSDVVDKACISGLKVIERGTIEIIVFVRSGEGYTQAVHICDLLQEFFILEDTTPVDIESVTSASEFASGDASGKYFGCSVDVSYLYSFTI